MTHHARRIDERGIPLAGIAERDHRFPHGRSSNNGGRGFFRICYESGFSQCIPHLIWQGLAYAFACLYEEKNFHQVRRSEPCVAKDVEP